MDLSLCYCRPVANVHCMERILTVQERAIWRTAQHRAWHDLLPFPEHIRQDRYVTVTISYYTLLLKQHYKIK